ncbi:MAG: hypothetical protein ABSA92_13190 [Candidatus Bathyarchaeia archaeon]
MDCPYCREWMPCTARTEKWEDQGYVTILSYACEECGRRWENSGDGHGIRSVQA